jgi:pyridoxal phosphate enzyme (YggS family)
MTTSTSPTSSSSPLAARLAAVREGVSEAARAAGRAPEELTTIVVTKFHPAALVRELAELGVRNVGENRHQEAQQKATELADLDLTWHFVGQLQSKKARQARRYASVIHSVDRVSLVDALASDESDVDVFVQLNLTEDAARGGVADRDLEPLVEHVLDTPGLRLLGVMAVAPVDEEPARAFERVRAASDRVRSIAPEAASISAGMSQDYREAIAAGATHLRIGTAITGNRPELR